MESVMISGSDFKTIHNTLCELRSIVKRMEHSMIKSDELERVVEGFEIGLRDAYDQDNSQFEEKMNYYGRFQDDNDLEAVWSIYELPLYGFLQDHPYPSDVSVVYQGHRAPVEGRTWGDLYRAADQCVRLSGDSHHIFIERFDLKGCELRLTTGS